MRYILLFLLICSSLAFAATNPICTDGFTLVNNKCWKLFSTSANHQDAEKNCNLFSGTLFTAKNAIDNRAMISFLNNKAVDRVWMGLYCQGSDRSKCYWDDEVGTADTYSSFASGFPNYSNGKCVYYSVSVSGVPGGQWASYNCNFNVPYVCELPTTTADDCPNNYNNYCYFPLSIYTYTQVYAQQVCEEMCANLVSVHSANENRYLTNRFGIIGLGGMIDSDGRICWIDGSPVDYTNMGSSSNGNCLSMRHGVFESIFCSNIKFVCKRPAGVPCVMGTELPPLPTVAPVPINPQTCNTDLMMAPGYFTSPNYPNDYPVNIFCTYSLGTTGAKRIVLTFDFFETESKYDIVKIYDGASDRSPLIAEYSGKWHYEVIEHRSTGPNMFVTFVSDHNHVYKGFEGYFYSFF